MYFKIHEKIEECKEKAYNNAVLDERYNYSGQAKLLQSLLAVSG
jgi:hypothetical protein